MPVLEPPFLRTEELKTEPWWLGLDGEDATELSETLEGWDTSRTITASRSLTLDPRLVAEQTGLSPDSTIRLLAGWYCESTRTRSFGAAHTTRATDAPREFEVQLSIPGDAVAVALALQTTIVLVEAGPESASTSARLPGSVLYQDSSTVHLEGVASRFPTEWIAFEEAAFPSKAAWFLDWDPTEPETSVLGGLRLYLNASHPRLSKLLEAEDDTTAVLLEAIELDIIRQLVAGAFSSYEITEYDGEFEAGTIGDLARRLMRVYFPFYSARNLKRLRVQDLARFEATFQDAAWFLGGGAW